MHHETYFFHHRLIRQIVLIHLPPGTPPARCCLRLANKLVNYQALLSSLGARCCCLLARLSGSAVCVSALLFTGSLLGKQ